MRTNRHAKNMASSAITVYGIVDSNRIIIKNSRWFSIRLYTDADTTSIHIHNIAWHTQAIVVVYYCRLVKNAMNVAPLYVSSPPTPHSHSLVPLFHSFVNRLIDSSPCKYIIEEEDEEELEKKNQHDSQRFKLKNDVKNIWQAACMRMNAMYDLVNDDNVVIGTSWKCKVARTHIYAAELAIFEGWRRDVLCWKKRFVAISMGEMENVQLWLRFFSFLLNGFW